MNEKVQSNKTSRGAVWFGCFLLALVFLSNNQDNYGKFCHDVKYRVSRQGAYLSRLLLPARKDKNIIYLVKSRGMCVHARLITCLVS